MLSAGGSLFLATFLVAYMMFKDTTGSEWLQRAAAFKTLSMFGIVFSLLDLMGSIGSFTGLAEAPTAIFASVMWLAVMWKAGKILKSSEENWAVQAVAKEPATVSE